MAIFSRIKSAISRALAPKSTGITTKAPSSSNIASAYSGMSAAAAQINRPETKASVSIAPFAPKSTGITPGSINVGNLATSQALGAGGAAVTIPARNIFSAPSASSGVTPANSYGGTTPVTVSAGSRPSTISTATSEPTFDISETSLARMSVGDSGISSSALTAPSASVSMPAAPSYSNVGMLNTAGLDTLLADTYQKDPSTGQFVKIQTNPEQDEAQRRKSELQDLLGFIPKKDNLLEDPQYQSQLAEVNRRKQEVANYTAQLNSVIAKQQADLLTLRGIGAQEGVTEAVYGGQAATINREAAIKALPIQAQISAAQGNLELAQDYLNQIQTIRQSQIDADYNYNIKKFDAISGFLSAEQKARLDKIKDNESFARQVTLKNMDTQKALADKAIEKGRVNLLSQIYSADPASPNFTTQLSRVRQTLDAEEKSTGFALTEAQKADPFIQKIVSSAGGKALTDTTIQKLDKGLTVLGQLGVLQSNIENAKTGPITGAFRSANPWDTQAQTIKNQLNAIVPNLARGVYGEVGVLTDNDIATYSKTIPSLKSTEEVRNAVLYITLDMIGKSIKNTLNVNASAGRDVSGFLDIYTEMENAKNSILSSIPSAQVPTAFQGGTQTTTGITTPESLRSKYGY